MIQLNPGEIIKQLLFLPLTKFDELYRFTNILLVPPLLQLGSKTKQILPVH